MKYIQLKKLLNKAGFELKYIQTGGNLDVLSFIHPNIIGEVFVEFDNNIKLPKNIEEGGEIDYNNEKELWLMNAKISMIDFNIDKSIFFMSNGILDTVGADEENRIILLGKDLKLCRKVINIIVNPNSLIDFQREFYKNQLNFLSKMSRFIPILQKYGLIGTPVKRSGNQDCLFPSISIIFGEIYSNIDFYIEVLTWKSKIFVNIHSIESKVFDLDCNLEEFEAEVINQLKDRELAIVYQKSIVDKL